MADVTLLNEEQQKAIQHDNSPLLIIAGAGTGKTTVITERIKHFILEKKVAPVNILALTFTEKAALEMEERIDIAMPYGYTQMWIATFHAFCDRVLRNEAIHIGLDPSYKLTTEAEALLFLRKHLFDLQLDYFRPLGNPNKFLEGLLQHFSRLKDEDVSPKEYSAFAQNLKTNPPEDMLEEDIVKTLELAHAFQTYENLKIKEGMMDFSDLISQVLHLFRTRKNVLQQYQKQFEHILIDEFQDTNYAQNQLALLLAGTKHHITVVGDDDQAIYRWRGAAISNMMQFRKNFPKATIITLTKNYRSTEEILDKAYTLIQYNNPDRLEVKENINKKLIAVRNKKGKPVEFIFADRVENEAEEVAKKIKELVNKKNTYGDIAILVRANDHAQPFMKVFEREQIPYQFLGPGRLFQQEEIRNVIAYLKILDNFEDATSLYRVLTMPLWEITGIEIAAITNLAKKKNYSLFEALEHIDETFLQEKTKEKIKQILTMIKSHVEKVPQETAGQVLFYFLKDSGLLTRLINGKTEQDDLKIKNLAKFFDKLKSYEGSHENNSVSAVIEWIDLCIQMGESPLTTDTDWSENNAVNILTIHASKGLEFPVVFLVSLVSQRFPSRERKEQIPIPQTLIKEILPEGDFHLQEERRLFYVAITRARDQLFLTAANFYGEGKRERKISPFVYEALGENTLKNLITQQKAKKIVIQPSLLEWRSETKPQEAQLSDTPRTLAITYLSYSQMQMFDICPLHYKLRYIMKIPTPMSSPQSFGTSVHATLRDYYHTWMTGGKASIDDVQQLLRKNWITEGYLSKSHEKVAFEKAFSSIKTYLTNNFDPKKLPIALELPFQFYVQDQKNLLPGLKVGGRIDRIDKIDENTIEIIDYKTGSNIPDEKKLAKDLQLTVYALAATAIQETLLNKTPEQVLLSLYYLEDGKKVTTTRTAEQLEEAKQTILQTAQKMATSDFLCSGSILCQHCEYKILCSVL